MIIDSLSNAAKYFGLHKSFEKSFDFIKTIDPATSEAGKFTIDGKDVHASIAIKETGVKPEDAKFEAHKNYMDIQVVLGGSETFGWKPVEKCVSPKDVYNTEKDIIFYNDKPDTYFTLLPGQFAIFFPEDVHAPVIGDGPIKKLVVKVKI